ncbi:hypothetical protein [Filomicrobium sp.]|uniref:hypothetical protein n=1 Tax=Filomicrobium sp. TaxID=2024831 RepID=UPI002585D737|nr:hypothetical protein [Filomicrobium sp.]MCV0371285.1 hypothetical protein [Filomicrobium sp.]
MKTTVMALALTGSVAIAALMGGATGAEAGGKHGFKHHLWKHNFHHFHHHNFHRPRGCGFYKAKWYATGKFYWKKRYFICKGWW